MLLCPPMPRAGLDPEIVTEAAAAIVDAEGLAAMTLARLAASLRVAPPSLYKHIGGLEDLTVRVATLAIRRLVDRLVARRSGARPAMHFTRPRKRTASSRWTMPGST